MLDAVRASNPARSSRTVAARAAQVCSGRAVSTRSVAAVTSAVGGALVPVPGGVLVRGDDELLGAVGVTGDTSDHDEDAAVAGVLQAGLRAQID